MSSTSTGPQTAQLLSTVFHAKDLHKRRGRIQVTSFPSGVLPVARRSAVGTSSLEAYSLLQTSLRYTISQLCNGRSALGP